MKWKPVTAVRSTIVNRLNVSDYKRDYAFDFETGQFVDNGSAYVSGLDAFIQKVVKFVLTDSEKFSYGLMNKIFQASDQYHFDEEASDLATKLVSQSLNSFAPDGLNGLGHTIESVESIESTIINEKNYLLITLQASGHDRELVIRIPYPRW